MSKEASMSSYGHVVDWDTHFWQPVELWLHHVEPAYRDAVANDCAMTEHIPPATRAKAEKAMQEHPADDPDVRLRWMDSEGIDACVIYPTLMAYVQYVPDAHLAAAACRGLNAWAAEYAAAAPDRLLPCMLLPWYEPELALAEFERQRDLGFRLAFSTPTPSVARRWSDPAYDPLWGALQDAGVAMTFHEFTRVPGAGQTLVARPSYADCYPMGYLCGHTVEIQLAVMDVILGGVLRRFPELVFGFVEAHAAWLPGWLSMLDTVWERPLTADTVEARADDALSPSELFRRQCYIVAFPEDRDLDVVVDRVGVGALVVGSDYPHPNKTDGLVSTFRRSPLSAGTQAQVLGGNADRLLRWRAASTA